MSSDRSTIRLAVLLFVAFAFSAGFDHLLTIGRATPNLALVFLVVACLFVDGNGGVLLGFMVGMLQASYAEYVGSTIFTRTLVGYIVGSLEARLFRDNAIIAVATVLLGTVFVESVFFVCAPQRHPMAWFIGAGYESLYNGLLAIPVYFIVRRAARGRE